MKKKFGHYEVKSELGRGGMGVVYKAFEPTLNRYVAIKALGEHLLNDDGLIERFTREAKSMAAINHPNVIQVYYIGKEGKQPYFAMEFIEGISLDELLTGKRQLAVNDAKNILRQACAGLNVAHENDLVHRDIKPANLMICKDGTVKVVDFGIAQTREYGDKLTNTGEFVGTPGYLSPEVCTGQEVDARSDIFALGIVFYEMLAGKVPFENDSPLGLMLEVVQSQIPDIRQLNKKVDKKTHFILEKMIAKNRDERFQTCAEILQQLGPITSASSLELIKTNSAEMQPLAKKVSQQVTQQAAQTLAAAVTKPTNQTAQTKPRKTGRWIAAAVFLLAAGTGLAWYQGYIPNFWELQRPPLMSKVMNKPENANTFAKSPFKSQAEQTTLSEDQSQQEIDQSYLTESAASEDKAPAKRSIFDDLTALVSSKNDPEAGQNDTATGELKVLNPADNEQTETRSPISDDLTAMSSVNPTDNSETLDGRTHPDRAQEVTSIQDDAVSELNGQNSVVTENLIAKVELPHKNVAQQAQQKSKPKPIIKRDKGIAVLVFGDPAVANPIKKIIESELKGSGLKVMNEQFVPGLNQSMNAGIDMADIRQRLNAYGGQQLVIANVNFVGEQMLEYYGRQSIMVNAQLDVDSYDLASGDALGSGYGADLSYTSLNATQTAQEAVMGFVDRLKNDLKTR